MNYIRFVLANPRYLGFGFLLTFFSGFGQTFFIGGFKESILGEFSGLTHTSYGSYYSIATLSSAACLLVFGRQVDHIPLRRFTIFVLLGLTAACLVLSLAQHLAILVLALFMLRFFGQGLMGHTANTAIARYYDRDRGKALSFINLGHPASEALLPPLLVLLLSAAAWQTSWQVYAAIVGLGLIPVVAMLLAQHETKHRDFMAQIEPKAEPLPSDDSPTDNSDPAIASHPPKRRQWTAREVLRDPGFYLILPAILAPPFVGTGLFFHQDVLKQSMSWSAELFSSSFSVFAFAQVAVTPFAGSCVDRYSAGRLLPFFLLPYAAGLTLTALVPGETMAFVLMASIGVSGGIGSTVLSSLWAERYGVVHLGAIRTLITVSMVVSTALSPPLVGLLIDRGITMPNILLAFAGYCAIGIGLLSLAARRAPQGTSATG